MKRTTLLSGLLSAGLISATLTGLAGPSASAFTLSVLTVTPVEPKVADVCWTPYEPTSGTVSEYQLSSPQISSGYIAVPATDPEPSQYCVTYNSLKPGVWYDFSLDALVGTTLFGAADLPTTGYTLSSVLRPTQVSAGSRVKVSGRLLSAGDGVSGATIEIQKRVLPSTSWSSVGSLKTDKHGRYSRAVKVSRNVKIRTYFQGIVSGAETVGAWNSDNPVNVSPVFSLAFSNNPVRFGQRVHATGSIRAGSVALLAGDPICLQQLRGHSWRSLKCVSISAHGRFAHWLTPKSHADLKYRWRASRGAPEYVAGNSRSVRLVVR